VLSGIILHAFNAYNDFHITMRGFTAANVAPAMYCVIVAAKTLTASEASGINYLSEDFLAEGTLEGKEKKDEFKSGCNRLFPMGPTCDFKGKDVPCFVSCSENGSITSHLFATVETLQKEGVLPTLDQNNKRLKR
jgi:hypothetical protein